MNYDTIVQKLVITEPWLKEIKIHNSSVSRGITAS
jgi:hypothetical protein